MGFNLKKGLKKISKGLKKIANVPLTIASESWKAAKKAWKSKVGRMVIIAAAVYFTGGVLATMYTPGLTLGSALASPSVALGGYAQAGSALFGSGSTAVTTGGIDATASTAMTANAANAGSAASKAAMEAYAAGAGAQGAAGAGAAATGTAGGVTAGEAGKLVAADIVSGVGGGGSAAAGLPTQVAQQAPEKGLLRGAWDSLGDYGRFGAVMTAGNMIQGAFEPTAEEIEAGRLRAVQNANSMKGTPMPGSTIINPSARLINPMTKMQGLLAPSGG